MPVYVSRIAPQSIGHIYFIETGILVWLCLIFPVLGHASDRLQSRETVMLSGGVGMMSLSYLLFEVTANGREAAYIVVSMMYAVALAAWGAPMCSWMVEAFPVEARFSAVAIVWSSQTPLHGSTQRSLHRAVGGCQSHGAGNRQSSVPEIDSAHNTSRLSAFAPRASVATVWLVCGDRNGSPPQRRAF
mmetsp:Transcript_30373/g.91069  ORF Transcript_30373/g.91069 Transcript_30373/m.91069 type:complete len:188 (-) Transcript_30373:58-621(-)